MRTKLTILAGALIFGASMGQAATSYLLDFNTYSNSPGLVYDGGYAISPYTGTINGTQVTLYCDDFNDSIQFGQQNIQVYKTALTAPAADLASQTRYGVDNPSSNSSYPSGLTLYEEMAWLATQMQHTGTTNDKAIQEAIWQLTDAPGGNTAPNNSHYNYGTASAGDTGTAQSASHWIQDAQNYISGYSATSGTSSWGYASHYEDLVLGDWYIVTAVNAAGCTTGYHNPSGCNPDGSSGWGSTTQEFLAYIPGTSGATPPPPSGVPEPATFVLIGSGLVAGAVLRRRKA
ncbi:MAG TPA: PEP-CTERM sorting domain-containing protein [Bryobacteraceae bacterium]|jgi:hypothetical protein|nr:PEP-CTERM sorting domain-containing protein [Bryobacteraceae bacterium]